MINHVEFPGLGLSFVINRVAFWIGDFPIYWYGVCIATGLLLALCFAFHYAEDFGIDSDRMAVSYTHLDVYKRQGLHRGGHFGGGRPSGP